jgi:hypothetical protein
MRATARIRVSERMSIPARRAQIEWNDHGTVRVFERRFVNDAPAWDRPGHDFWPYSDGACWGHWEAARGWKLLALVLGVHNRLIVDYKIPAATVEAEFMKINEYRAFMNRGMEAQCFGEIR